MTAARDRNAEGRAESSRPRDGLGRPLPYGSQGVERVQTRPRTPSQALAEAQDYLDRELPFHAHEVLEEQWKSVSEEDRALWQGLAQLAVGLTHQRRGNLRGARAVTARGAQAIAGYVGRPPHQIDVRGLLDWARELVEDGGAGAPVPRLRRD